MKTDADIQRDVQAELEWEPSLDAAGIGVAVSHGVVTLTGQVKSYAEKMVAEKAAGRVAGVRAIAEEIRVCYPSDPKTSDQEIARRVADLFDWDVMIPGKTLHVQVEHGRVTLSGTVDWEYQRRAARTAAGKINGVVGINNLIEVRKAPVARDVRDRIVAAIRRQADADGETIQVETRGNRVILSGRVKAWHERQLAERAAWATPGVGAVDDRITLAI
ncbi:BON domain-containing protein [Sphingomonas changnyeongensis]|uniref:BON domain-containing protein n=1 Tax=Sphingomonas changnyeongensis TaxID=2698679 RepID=A0A7Z2NVZ1_9SPHN|nr:BON domain-containing protein [Sphingomonas changnyeongensis]QHL90476.1 BON domain-containing protein [Sphingomonas changnyeongensis]